MRSSNKTKIISRLLASVLLAVSPEIFHTGGDTGQSQAAQQDHKDPSNICDAQAGRFTTVTFLLNRIAGGR